MSHRGPSDRHEQAFCPARLFRERAARLSVASADTPPADVAHAFGLLDATARAAGVDWPSTAGQVHDLLDRLETVPRQVFRNFSLAYGVPASGHNVGLGRPDDPVAPSARGLIARA